MGDWRGLGEGINIFFSGPKRPPSNCPVILGVAVASGSPSRLLSVDSPQLQ